MTAAFNILSTNHTQMNNFTSVVYVSGTITILTSFCMYGFNFSEDYKPIIVGAKLTSNENMQCKK